MFRRLLILIGIALCATPMAHAIMANPNPVTITQPDGTQLTIRIHGDEAFHYTTTTDGYLIRKDTDGFFKYYDFEGKKLTAQVASNIDIRSQEESRLLAGLKTAKKVLPQMFKQHPINKKTPLVTAPATIAQYKNNMKRAAAQEVTHGEYLVILVGFKDNAFTFKNEAFDTWLNQEGYSTDGGTGSVKDYYRDNSMGRFIPNFTVLGPFTLPQKQTYYAGNSEETGEDTNPRAMIVDACNLAKAAHPEIDFSIFDNNNDGLMDNVNVIYAGYSEASTGNADDMWPHSWTLEEEAITIDNVKINAYACSAEFVGASGEKMDGIGTFAHEFGHLLGLKDVYDTDQYYDGYGLDPGQYSIYASGSYNNDSRTPPCLMAFERVQLGWCEAIELKEAADIELAPISENVAYYINAQPGRAEGTGYEWFVLENRQKTGWDTYIPAHGLLIYHYDYTDEMVEKYWSVNGPNNNSKHRCMYIKPADGIDDTNTRNGDTYPGRSGNTQFTDDSFPNSISWAGERSNTPITNIREENGYIYFQVKGGVKELSVINTLVPENIRDKSVTAKANLVSNNKAIVEMGFCWDTQQDPTVENSAKQAVAQAENINAEITGLTPGTGYYIRAYMILEDQSVVYGAAIPFKTECEVAVAPFISDFMSWTDGELDCWKIIDNNCDGTTWVYDKSVEAILYQFDYWNNADDWLISTRMLVPENGHFYFVRGVVEPTTVEQLEVYVSTHSRNIEDFHLVKQFSFADNFGTQVPEEVDLSDYAGQEIYIALVCKSEKLQSNLWIWQTYLASALEAPVITKFDLEDDALVAEWTEVENAARYHLEFYEVTDQLNNISVFLPSSEWERVEGDVKLGTGLLEFTGDAVVETRSFPYGLTDMLFMLYSSGPTGTTTLTIEGSVDGSTWELIGPAAKVNNYNAEGTEMFLSEYMTDKGYQRIRLTCQHGGRNLKIRYFTLGFNDGYVWEYLTGGAVYETGITINPIEEGEFKSGKTYAIQVYAGDGILYFDGSEPAFYSYDAAVEVIMSDDIHAYVENGNIIIQGLVEDAHILCSTPEGVVLYNNEIKGQRTHTIAMNNYQGVVIIRLDRNLESRVLKMVVK